MPMVRVSNGGTSDYPFYFNTPSSGSANYGGVYISVSDLSGKSTFKVTIDKTITAKAYNNNVYYCLLDSSYSQHNSAVSSVGNNITIPSTSGYVYLMVYLAGLSTTSGGGEIFARVTLS